MMEWHAKTKEEVIRDLQGNVLGLNEEEAIKRLQRDGKNRLDSARKTSMLAMFFRQFQNVMVIVLLAAALVSAAVAIFERQPTELIDCAIILFIVIVNAVVGVIQEHKAEQALEALQNMSRPFAKVRRGGKILSMETSEVAVGDVVLLESGDAIPADVRLTQTHACKVDESALTGESAAVDKDADCVLNAAQPMAERRNMAYSGCMITCGRAEGIVVETGMRTEMGKIAGLLKAKDRSLTPIQKQMDKTGKILSIAVIIIAALIFGISMLSCISTGFTFDRLIDAFMTGIAIAVAAIPEGLTAVITIIMALGVQIMSRRNAIIRKLPAVETLGSCEVICSDKTGTLTENKMQVVACKSAASGATSEMLRCMALCNDASEAVGEPTERALMRFAEKNGIDTAKLNEELPRVGEQPFSSDRKRMSTKHRTKLGFITYTKGACEVLLDRCEYVLDGERVRAMTQLDRKQISGITAKMASSALRVLMLARRDDGSLEETGLTYLGIVGLCDPPRPEVKQAVEVCRGAGIRPVMITGDHRDTACAIAKQLGILSSEKELMTGAELDRMDDDELRDCVHQYSVFARVSPLHKVRIVCAWKKRGKIVAMTGDGVNDAPSVKAADIGIGMGKNGTDVTKSVADMVLADDNFATIIVAIKEGRKIYGNILKTIQFLLSANVAEVLSLFLATILFAGRGYAFLLPIQLLWINLVTDSLPALALGMERSERRIMLRPPVKSRGNLLSGEMGQNIIFQGLIQTFIVLTVYIVCIFTPWGHRVGTTMAFVVLNMIQLFHCFNCKSLDNSIMNRDLLKNPMMILSLLIGTTLTVGVVFIPPIGAVFGLTSLTAVQWGIALFSAFMIIPIVEWMKRGKKRRAKYLQG